MNAVLGHEISRLSQSERLALIGELWDSIDGGALTLTKAQGKELERRIDMLDEERSRAVPWEVVKADLSTRIRN